MNSNKLITSDACCGNCAYFYAECTDGDGICAQKPHEDNITLCDRPACSKHISRQQARHYIATLIQANRYRRDQNVPSIHKMPNPKELGEAIDFAVEFYQKYSRL